MILVHILYRQIKKTPHHFPRKYLLIAIFKFFIFYCIFYKPLPLLRNSSQISNKITKKKFPRLEAKHRNYRESLRSVRNDRKLQTELSLLIGYKNWI